MHSSPRPTVILLCGQLRLAIMSARETAELLLLVGRLVQAEGYDGELSPAQWMALRFFARAPSVLWLALLLGLVYAAGRTVGGPTAGALAVAGAALDPNLVAHASLATSELPLVPAAPARKRAAAVKRIIAG